MDIEIVVGAAIAVGAVMGFGSEYFLAVRKTKKFFKTVQEYHDKGDLTEEEIAHILKKAMTLKDAYDEIWNKLSMKGVFSR